VASFNAPRGVGVDPAGVVYVADTGNNVIRKIWGNVSTIAGSGAAAYADGTGTAAAFNAPYDVVGDAAGAVYVADTGNDCIRKINTKLVASDPGYVTTIAGRGVGGVTLSQPQGLALDAGGTLYFSDTGNHRVCMVSAGAVTVVAGGTQGFADGNGAAARFDGPAGLKFDVSGNLFVADRNNQRVRQIAPDGTVSTVAGSGVAGYLEDPVNAVASTLARFGHPTGLAIDLYGRLYVSDTDNNRVRIIN
jgi:sugar lactone lactonase YvrE